MTLIGAILKKVQSTDSVHAKRLASPPPELEDVVVAAKRMKKRRINKFAHVRPRVSTAPTRYDATTARHNLLRGGRSLAERQRDNFVVLTRISRQHYIRGRVDSHWRQPPPPCLQYFMNRLARCKRMEKENRALHHLLAATPPRVPSTKSLQHDWAENRRRIISMAEKKFVLFPLVPRESMEDQAFRATAGVVRARVSITLQQQGGPRLGPLHLELFTDVCPATCQLFLDLLAGDPSGYSYVGTTFFRKVPHMYWCGGDVVHDSGFGCFMQAGRVAPIATENYHFSHSMPGLLSMHVTADDEVCGIFNISFKPLPQFDLQNVVFARVIRPSAVFDVMCQLGKPCSPHPVVKLVESRLPGKKANEWKYGAVNTRLEEVSRRCVCIKQLV